MKQSLGIVNMPAISAIYYALLQTGYDGFHALGKDAELIRQTDRFRSSGDDFDSGFFAQVKQRSCEVYPYWPRAAALETAVFFLDRSMDGFKNFSAYKAHIMASPNIADEERGKSFWDWVAGFPHALSKVLNSRAFKTYLSWENGWIDQQTRLLADKLRSIRNILTQCENAYEPPVRSVTAVICPIKCAYSSDYHREGKHLLYISGAFRSDALLHEYLHPIVHPFIGNFRKQVAALEGKYPGFDASYYLSGDDAGKLNAFEEYAVRSLTSTLMAGMLPPQMDLYLKALLKDFTHQGRSDPL